MVSLGGLFRIVRPMNSIMVGFAVLVGAAIGGSSISLSGWNLFFAFLTGFFLCGSAMSINDYYDRDIDAINEPKRPIPSGVVTSKEALVISSIFSILGLSTALLTSIENLMIAVFAWICMMVYSTIGKRTGLLGNVLVSICISLPFVYGGIMSKIGLSRSFIFALIAFLANTGREMTKGIVDIDGDKASGIRTVAVTSGPLITARISVFCYILAVIMSFLPIYYGIVSFWYIPFVAITDLGLIYYSISLLKKPSRENSREVKNKVLLLMLSGLFGFLLGNLF